MNLSGGAGTRCSGSFKRVLQCDAKLKDPIHVPACRFSIHFLPHCAFLSSSLSSGWLRLL